MPVNGPAIAWKLAALHIAVLAIIAIIAVCALSHGSEMRHRATASGAEKVSARYGEKAAPKGSG